MKKILVIGQIPPPYGGQAMMIKRLVTANFNKIKIYHIRMSFSNNFKQVGKAEVSKILHLIWLIFKTIFFKFRYGISNLYYPPSGPNFFPVIRDVIFLLLVRPFFKTTIFHFRAAGVSEYINTLNNMLVKQLALLAYKKPSLSIQLSGFNPSDGRYFQSDRIEIIPNGIEDEYVVPQNHYNIALAEQPGSTVKILFVGVLQRSKGLDDLIEAVSILRNRNIYCLVNVLGEFVSGEYEEKTKLSLCKNKLTEYFKFHGVKTGIEKYDFYRHSNIFCFPSFFESESFGNVILEAMMFKLPVVATRWRGIQDIVDDGTTGFLVKINSPNDLADKLQFLIQDNSLREAMGNMGRKKYLQNYTLEQHLVKMEEVLSK